MQVGCQAMTTAAFRTRYVSVGAGQGYMILGLRVRIMFAWFVNVEQYVGYPFRVYQKPEAETATGPRALAMNTSTR
jgi:hypothetical protein